MVATANSPAVAVPTTTPVVDIRGLSKTYRLMTGKEIHALSDLTFDIQPGETFAIVGPNGSGKTTTMKILLGMLFPTTGEAEIFGHMPGDVEAQRRIGYLPEAPYFYEYLNGRELLHYYGKLCGVPTEERTARIEVLLKMVDLHERGADMPIRVYSRGMRQRIGIAQAMINNPDLLILDEPTNGLDPIGTVQVRQFILEQKKQHRTILLCSHLLSEVEAVADRVAILHLGRLIAVGPVSELVPESQQWQLVATNLSRDGIAAFKDAGFKPEVHGDVMTLRVENLDDVYRGMNLLHAQSGELIEVTRPQSTLEEQFLKAVGEETLRRTVDTLQKGAKTK
ncbi:MAG TPA: ABC transporter ATP-binding protein [Armatimonadota bacterium]|jgi:ABC-2 type transport system ATP-binding protein